MEELGDESFNKEWKSLVVSKFKLKIDLAALEKEGEVMNLSYLFSL